MRSRPDFILVALSLAACVADSSPPPGVVDADALPRLILHEERRIGSATDPDVGFATVGAMAMDDAGRVYVYESRDRRIRVYGAAGELLHTIGEPGEGPGELGAVTALGVRGDTVWVVESGPGRILRFTGSGEPLSTATVGTAPVRPLAMRGDGFFSSQAFGRGLADVPRVRFDAMGAIVDTVGREPPPLPAPDLEPWVTRSPRSIEFGGVSYAVPQPPGDAPLWVAFDDGSAVIDRRRASGGTDAEFTLTRFAASADTTYHIRFRYRPGRYDGAVLDTIAMRPVVRTGEDPAAFRGVRAALDYPPFQSPIYTARAAEDGGLWMRREDDAGPHFRWIVVRPDGTVRGFAPLPRNIVPVWARADTLWVTATDELGIPWLVRLRIQDP